MQEGGSAVQTQERTIEWENVPCDLCGSAEFDRLLDGVDWEFGRTEAFCLVRCNRCGLIFLNPRPAPCSIPLLYPPSYSNFRQSSGLRRLLKKVYYKVAAPYPYLRGMKPGCILDVGCATGHTNYPYGENGSLRQLKRQGWDVSGLELNENAASIARSYGITVYMGRLSDVPSIAQKFDVVRFNHVLEHSVSPTDDLLMAAALLKENGRLFVSGPNIDSAAFTLFHKYWSGLDLPRHFYQFSPATLRKYCEKANLQIAGEYHDGRSFDVVHSVRHFLQSREVSGRHTVCQGIGGNRGDAIHGLFSPLSRICLYIAVHRMVGFFNRAGLSDSLTIVAVPK
jgi:2-polyprenyl-3-methyl-5-hydroxy-6-metoxy-1,4-benzoquinol methylase